MKSNRSFKFFFTITLIAIGAIFVIGAEALKEPVEQKTEDNKDEARLNLPIANIDTKPITVGFVETATSKQSPMLRREFGNEEKLLEFINKLIDTELLASEAERRGFKDHSEVSSVTKNQLASLMHRRIADSIEEEKPDEEELKKYYDDHHQNYNKPEKVRARHILVADQNKAKKLLADLKGKKVSQHEFRRLAQENSEDESTRLRGGDLTFFSKIEDRKEGDPDIEPKVVQAAFQIKKNGDIFPELVKSSKGYHIVMRTGHRDAMNLSFEDARDRLTVLVRREIRKKKVEDSINALKKQFKVEISEENLKYVVIDLSLGPPDPDAKGGLTKNERRRRKKNLISGVKKPKPGKPQKRAKKPKSE
ncbi:MAG: peptidylprolyl isomerase [Proteobacteria bacterium]|nr:peptidylprolyl isomerase [Pseudomonadota bacterium]